MNGSEADLLLDTDGETKIVLVGLEWDPYDELLRKES